MTGCTFSAESLRAALAARCGDDSPPGAWRAAAAAAGVAGADAFLCHLSQSIARALEVLAASAEAARTRLWSAGSAFHVDDTTRFVDLEGYISSAETTKRVILERELCAVDAGLEKLRAERGAAAEAAVSLGDAELVAQHAELTARLDAADAQLLALPTSVVEPPHVGLVIDESALLDGNAAFGQVVAPRAITAADLTLEGAPSYAYPGCTLTLRLVFQGADHTTQSAEELEVSLGAAAAATHVEASLQTEGAPPQLLQADISVDTPGRCLSISIAVPVSAPVGSSVCFGPLTVSGQPVAGLLGALQVEPPCPSDLSPEHAAWLQSQLPPGGSSSPGAWEEVYRATIHGFGAAAFHTRCDGRARLLVLIRGRGIGWLFGGFTAVGFIPGPTRDYADPSAFIFSLTNSLGRPEKLDSLQTGCDIVYSPADAVSFGWDLVVCGNADVESFSYTSTGRSYTEAASTGVQPMARGDQEGWRVSEIVAWVV